MPSGSICGRSVCGDINSLSFGQAVTIGRRLRLSLSEVEAPRFIEPRVAYPRAAARFFEQFHIEGTREQQVGSGNNLWLLAQRELHLPVWLLPQ